MQKGKLIVFSAPSGAGKTTLVKHALEKLDNLSFSVSCTTRNKREGEIDGKDYYFISPEEFKKRIDDEEFVEWEEVYHNNYYGTLKSEIERITKDGHSVIFDMDVEGALNIKNIYGDQCLTVFVQPPSLEILRDRLITRNTESEDKLKQRLDKADIEMAAASRFDVLLMNDDLAAAKDEALAIITKFVR
ncbi:MULTISPECIES: guanylate kinase [Weeksella]|uniref:Guanylate kinase n=1 Tax=Weeksella virosa (strain ATCC 43766 / DSM 16922 / JCM 21250 / CCUG 30538 / CDC 9751 / IAM 14551 / NBRC 16016 / NCTC 11634 / CL345/78) TaxID=865938 RepID=F0NYH6_WEEVC|nr:MULTISPECIES: guanylate kinase [Weeksella]ADX67096.1 Guanylate kinase [Weeksella virosa DSM 16922]MDK7375662.1 guanylate kinase [Weeksella virosa]MDK7675023.1 guanylate kinase [Weeksella virosa]OFM82377.1 guanylate kinase [Weeksella sp. HMSC059D05]VEH63167.1 Guanylate kinase [Weeksella virosa]